MSQEYCDHIADMLSGWADVKSKRMFGGFGLYNKDLIFAIVIEDILYFKVGDANRAEYEHAGVEPFSYEAGGGKRVVMSYWQVPDAVLDDEEGLARWAQKAYQISKVAASAKKQKKTKKGAGDGIRKRKN